jgi:hypothetical protein
MGTETPTTLATKYGAHASMNEIIRRRWRLALRKVLTLAWSRRRNVTDSVTHPCPCFQELPLQPGPHETIEAKHINCQGDVECSMARELKSRPEDLIKLRDAVRAQPEKPENERRSKALKELYRLPKQPLDRDACRNLGDAVFAFLAPSDSVILTTNQKDHAPLAQALGKTTQGP